jgi:outer membrane protein assembly factor BamA
VTTLMMMGLLASSAQADPRPPPDPTKGEPYDARAHPAELRDDLLVVPRLVLTPLRVLYNAIFYPIGWFVRVTQKYDALEKYKAATQTADGAIGVSPSFSLVSGYRPIFGLGFFDHKIVGEGTSLYVNAQIDFRSIIIVTTRFRPTHINRAVEYVVGADYTRRDDLYFQGIGMAAARDHSGSRYSVEQIDQVNALRFTLAQHWFAHATGAFGLRRYGNGQPVSDFISQTNDKPIEQVFCIRLFDGRCAPGPVVNPLEVPGFNEGTQFVRAGLGIRVDSRNSFYAPSSGAALMLDVDYTHGLGNDPSSYLRFTGVIEAVLDLWKRSHVLLLRGWTQALVPAGSQFVPFTEFPVFSTPELFRGARWGKYRDYTTVLVTAEYRWPVWMWMDAALFVDYGGAFGKGYAGFDVTQFIPAVGAALRLRTSSKFFMSLQGAYGFGEGWYMSFTGAMDLL